jgi:metallo-beta-lactamase family protein
MGDSSAADSPITVTFWGAAHTVTGSMHLIQAGRQRVLLDCGLFQGKRAESYRRNREFPFAPHSIDAVVITHAHVDHIGNLPNLVRRGFRGPIHCTPATRDLMAVMLADSAKIQAEDAMYLNKQRPHGEPPVQPLYDDNDVRKTMRLIHATPYDQEQTTINGIRHCLVDAGHLLGSAMVHLSINHSGGERTITFTGDLGRKNMPILRDPAPVPPAELLVSESTYGGRNHQGAEMLADDLGAVVRRTAERGGKVLIPAFALGRTQTIVFFLHQLINSGRLTRLPIFVDSPLSAAATEIFRLHPECFDDETAKVLYDDPDLFGEQMVRYTRTVEESKRLNGMAGPCVIIAASGMCESGRILHHLKHNLGDERNTVMIVGFQAPETLGRRLVEKRPEVRIHDGLYKVKAEIVLMNGFSGHAGRDELLAMLLPLKDEARKVRLVHGDADQAEALAQALRERGFADVAYPDSGETVALE